MWCSQRLPLARCQGPDSLADKARLITLQERRSLSRRPCDLSPGSGRPCGAPARQPPSDPHRLDNELKRRMQSREKSESLIVGRKSRNNTGEPAAEARERWAGAEENASQLRTRCTQTRESV